MFRIDYIFGYPNDKPLPDCDLDRFLASWEWNHEIKPIVCMDSRCLNPVSFAYPRKAHGKSYKMDEGGNFVLQESYDYWISNMATGVKVIFFIDKSPRGEIKLINARKFSDQSAGKTEEADVELTIDKVVVQCKKWNWWQDSYVEWVIDPIIRKKLGEPEVLLYR